MFTGAAYYMKDLPHGIHDQFMELGYHIYNLCTQSANTEAVRPLLFAAVVTLLMLTFSLNVVAILVRGRIRRRLQHLHHN